MNLEILAAGGATMRGKLLLVLSHYLLNRYVSTALVTYVLSVC